MIISDMRAGNGLCLLDPHGELVDDLLEYIPSNRINDVILFDVGDANIRLDLTFCRRIMKMKKTELPLG